MQAKPTNIPSLCPLCIPSFSLQTELFAHLCTLIRKSWSGQYSALYPKALKLILGEIYSPFASSRQQDCQEFLAIVLDSLHENELVRMSQAIEQGAEPMEIEQQQEEDGSGSVAELSVSFVTDTFQGTLKNEVHKTLCVELFMCACLHICNLAPFLSHNSYLSTTVFKTVTLAHPLSFLAFHFACLSHCVQVLCLKCSFVSVKREPFMYLSLPIPHALEEQLGGNAVPSHISVCGVWCVGVWGWGCNCATALSA